MLLTANAARKGPPRWPDKPEPDEHDDEDPDCDSLFEAVADAFATFAELADRLRHRDDGRGE